MTYKFRLQPNCCPAAPNEARELLIAMLGLERAAAQLSQYGWRRHPFVDANPRTVLFPRQGRQALPPIVMRQYDVHAHWAQVDPGVMR